MLALEIDNPEIELIFNTKFNGNKAKFINFIQDSLKNLDNKTAGEFAFTKLDPKENSYRLPTNTINEEMSNPFEEIDDILLFSQNLREKAYR
jgi:ribosomal protein S17E